MQPSPGVFDSDNDSGGVQSRSRWRSVNARAGQSRIYPFRSPAESWTRRLAALQADFDGVEMFAPLIVQYENDRLLIRDGNHRHGAYEARGIERCWIVLWYADETERLHHEVRGFRI